MTEFTKVSDPNIVETKITISVYHKPIDPDSEVSLNDQLYAIFQIGLDTEEPNTSIECIEILE